MHWFSKHNVNHLRGRRSRLSRKIPLGSVIAVFVRSEILPLLRDNLTLPLALLLVFLDPLILINAIHESINTPYWLLGQGFSQIKLGRQSDLKGPYSHIIKISMNLIKSPSTYMSTFSGSHLLTWTWTIKNLVAEEPYYT